MRHRRSPCRGRPHRAAALACRAHLAPLLPARRQAPGRTLCHQAERAGLYGEWLRADPNTPRARDRRDPRHRSAIRARRAERACSRLRRRRGAWRERLSDRSVPARRHQQAHRPIWRPDRRSRFLLEVVDAVTAVVGAERTGLRISPQNEQNDISDSDPQALFNSVASALSGTGLAFLHVIEGDTGGTPVPQFDYKEIKRRFGGIVIANNGFGKARANEAIAEGRADLIAFGKPFISNPDLVTRLYLDAPLAPANRETYYGGADQGYTDYPLLREVQPHACYCDNADRAWG